MTLNDSVQLLSKEASLALMTDMLRQAEADKRVLLETLKGVMKYLRGSKAKTAAEAAIEKVG